MKRIFLILLFICFCLLLFACGYWGIPSYKDDNPIEEGVEEAIKEETGWDIDLTPSTPEGA